jgi:ketosteroid isomerase-like protein
MSYAQHCTGDCLGGRGNCAGVAVNSTPQEVTGKYLVVWEKVGSDWKLAADIWNEDK